MSTEAARAARFKSACQIIVFEFGASGRSTR
jgi:hypothetical protein